MVDRVVLDEQFRRAQPPREAVGPDERRSAGVEAGQRVSRNRQQLLIPPEILRARGNDRRRHRRANRLVVVGHLERAQALAAGEERLGGIRRPAHPAAQPVK